LVPGQDPIPVAAAKAFIDSNVLDSPTVNARGA